jgi:molybdate transport system substrate-binding protein
VRLPLLVAGALLVAGCTSGSSDRTLTVFAAASLTDVFPQIASDFEREYPGVKVRFSFAGSQSLVAQVQQGAPADVLATADETSMAAVTSARDPKVFARNRLAIVAPLGEPVPSLKALGRPELRVVLGGPTVPVGRAAREALSRAEVTVHPVSEEPDVRSVLTKVALGEADAGIVYATDLKGATKLVTSAVLPPIVTNLPIAALDSSADAADFVSDLLSPEGQKVLADYGFAPP